MEKSIQPTSLSPLIGTVDGIVFDEKHLASFAQLDTGVDKDDLVVMY